MNRYLQVHVWARYQVYMYMLPYSQSMQCLAEVLQAHNIHAGQHLNRLDTTEVGSLTPNNQGGHKYSWWITRICCSFRAARRNGWTSAASWRRHHWSEWSTQSAADRTTLAHAEEGVTATRCTRWMRCRWIWVDTPPARRTIAEKYMYVSNANLRRDYL